jgi:hypothetical protein
VLVLLPPRSIRRSGENACASFAPGFVTMYEVGFYGWVSHLAFLLESQPASAANVWASSTIHLRELTVAKIQVEK